MDLDRVARDIDFQLLESLQQLEFEVAYPGPVLGGVVDVDDEQVQPVVVPAAPRAPGPASPAA
jgi:hypothetical protein